jgi:hypothetical protein
VECGEFGSVGSGDELRAVAGFFDLRLVGAVVRASFTSALLWLVRLASVRTGMNIS